MKTYTVWAREPQARSWEARPVLENIKQSQLTKAKLFIESKGLVWDHNMLEEPVTANGLADMFRQSVRV